MGKELSATLEEVTLANIRATTTGMVDAELARLSPRIDHLLFQAYQAFTVGNQLDPKVDQLCTDSQSDPQLDVLPFNSHPLMAKMAQLKVRQNLLLALVTRLAERHPPPP